MEFSFDKIKGFFSDLKGKGSEYAGLAVDKTKDAARLAKLTVELNSEKEALKKSFVELGKAYYEEHRGAAEGLFAQLCEEVDAANARIGAMEAEIAGLKGSFKSEEPASFEDVVAAGEEPAEPDIEVELVEEPDGE